MDVENKIKIFTVAFIGLIVVFVTVFVLVLGHVIKTTDWHGMAVHIGREVKSIAEEINVEGGE